MKVLITSRLPEEVVHPVRREHEVEVHDELRPMDREALLQRVGEVEGLLCTVTDRIDETLLGLAPHLKMIANYGVGYDNIDVDAASSRGIPVSNTPGVLTDATADLTFALILGVARRVVEGDQRTRQGQFRFWSPMLFLGTEVTGKTLGIVGLGRIGKAVAKRAGGFDMPVLYHNRHPLAAEEETRIGVQYRDLNNLLAESDIVSLHVPLSGNTRHLIGPAELDLMKPSACLINTSRGPVVDEQALLAALVEKRIAGAGLDVYENEPALTPGLTDLSQVILLPHAGSATLETRTAMGRLAAENLLIGLRGKTPPNCINPAVLKGKG